MFPFKLENNVCHKSLTWQNLVWKNVQMLLHWTKPTDFDHFTNKLTKYLCTCLHCYTLPYLHTYIHSYITLLHCFCFSSKRSRLHTIACESLFCWIISECWISLSACFLSVSTGFVFLSGTDWSQASPMHLSFCVKKHSLDIFVLKPERTEVQ